MPPAYLIDDGSNYEGCVPARAGGLPELTFTYRPATPLRCMRHGKATKGASPEAELAAHAALIVEHVVAWNVEDRESKPVERSVEAVGKLPWPYVLGLVNHIQGFGGRIEAAELGN